MKGSKMQNSSALLKQEFLKKWIKGLQIYTTNFNNQKNMTIFERKRAIKLSADVAMASTRSPSVHWSRSVMAHVSTNNDKASEILVEQIFDKKITEKKGLMITCSNKIMRRSRIKARRVVRRQGTTNVMKARSIAKRVVKSRTRVLKRLVPGGDEMNEMCLIKETLDYIVSLRAQVDVMRRLANVAERLDTQL